MVLTTKRLVLRPWQETDAADLYFYAKDERIGSVAGWSPHKNEQESLSIIKNIFMREEVYAVTLKDDGHAIGLIGLSFNHDSNFPIGENDAELSYWLGVPFWGQNIIPESINAIMYHAFADLKLDNLWCGYFQDNKQSRIAHEKCGFIYHSTLTPKFIESIGETKTEDISRITYKEWLASL